MGISEIQYKSMCCVSICFFSIASVLSLTLQGVTTIIGGGPIGFMQHFYGMNFTESVKYLLNGEEAQLEQTSP